MLKRFLLNSLSAFVGAWVALALFGVAAVLMVFAIIGSMSVGSMPNVDRHSILKLDLSGTIEERESPIQLDYTSMLMNGGIERPQTLDVIVKALREGANDKNIDALYIECNGAAAAPATFNAIRNEVEAFKKSGKRVYAYADAFSMGDYYVASVADSIFLNPYGEIGINGISGTILYYADLLEKLGVKMQVVKVGTFKSAVEPYIMNEMSAPARAQLDTLYGGMWNYIRDGIAKSRKIKSSSLDSMVNNFLMLATTQEVLKYKLVDKCIYKREVDAVFANLTGKDEKKLNYVSTATMASRSAVGMEYGSKNQIAVLYAVGDIAESKGAGIYCERLVPVIRELAENDKVKGLVLRVNSPGGSVFGSEQIGEALDYFQSCGKTLAVSMGDYAASGGYWISAGANRIFADPLTITGSIGIFGMMPDISGLAEKIGVHPQRVSTNPSVSFPNLFFPMTSVQHEALQTNVERGYNLFVARVAKGRKKSEQYIRSIAEGRVWSAIKAKEIGLVDQLGNLQDAIEWVAKENGIETKYAVSVYPNLEATIWDHLPEGLGASENFTAIVEKITRESPDRMLASKVMDLLMAKPVQARALEVTVRL